MSSPLAQAAASLDESSRQHAKPADRYRFTWVGIPLRPQRDQAHLMAVSKEHYFDKAKRQQELQYLDSLIRRLNNLPSDDGAGQPPNRATDPEVRRRRFLELVNSAERPFENCALGLIALIESRRTGYPSIDLTAAISSEFNLIENVAVTAAIVGMGRSNLRLSKSSILAQEWQQMEARHYQELFSDIVAPTALRMAAVIVGAVSGTGVAAIGLRIIGMITEAVLDLQDFLILLSDPETGEDEATAALVGLFPLISSRLELARAGLLIGKAIVEALISSVELWTSRMNVALGAYQAGSCGASFEDETLVCIEFDALSMDIVP